MKVPLARLNVTIGVAKLERITKTDNAMKPLIDAARDCVERSSAAEALAKPSAQPTADAA